MYVAAITGLLVCAATLKQESATLPANPALFDSPYVVKAITAAVSESAANVVIKFSRRECRSASPTQKSSALPISPSYPNIDPTSTLVAGLKLASGTPSSSAKSMNMARPPPESITAARPPFPNWRLLPSSANVVHQSSDESTRATPYLLRIPSNSDLPPAMRPAWVINWLRAFSVRPE